MNLVLLGKIVGTHGIKGEVKISSNSDFKSQRFKVGNTLYIKKNNDFIPIIICSYRVHKGLDLITFNDYKNINDVLEYVNLDVYVDYNDVNDLDEDEYYFTDLLDCKVYDQDNKYLGIVIDLLEVPQGVIIEIKNENNQKSLVPFNDEFIKEVDLDNKTIIIEPIEGLLWGLMF